MPRLAFRRSTGQPIPDFQRSATADGLLANAVRRGILPEDVEVRDLSPAEWEALEQQVYAAIRQARDEQEQQLRQQALAILQKLGLTVQEARLLARALAEASA